MHIQLRRRHLGVGLLRDETQGGNFPITSSDSGLSGLFGRLYHLVQLLALLCRGESVLAVEFCDLLSDVFHGIVMPNRLSVLEFDHHVGGRLLL